MKFKTTINHEDNIIWRTLKGDRICYDHPNITEKESQGRQLLDSRTA